MLQGNRWQADWPAALPITGAFATPLFWRGETGWIPRPDTAPHDLCEYHP